MTATIKEFLFRAAMMVHLQMHFSYPPYTFFAHRIFATIVNDLSLKNTSSAAGWARGGRRRRRGSGGLIWNRS